MLSDAMMDIHCKDEDGTKDRMGGLRRATQPHSLGPHTHSNDSALVKYDVFLLQPQNKDQVTTGRSTVE